MMVAFCTVHLLAAQYIPAQPSRGEVLVFKGSFNSTRKQIIDDEKAVNDDSYRRRDPIVNPKDLTCGSPNAPDAERSNPKQPPLLYWADVNYEIKGRKILQHVNGWLQPGTLTVLMVGFT